MHTRKSKNEQNKKPKEKKNQEADKLNIFKKYAAPPIQNFIFFDDAQRTFYLAERKKRNEKRY